MGEITEAALHAFHFARVVAEFQHDNNTPEAGPSTTKERKKRPRKAVNPAQPPAPVLAATMLVPTAPAVPAPIATLPDDNARPRKRARKSAGDALGRPASNLSIRPRASLPAPSIRMPDLAHLIPIPRSEHRRYPAQCTIDPSVLCSARPRHSSNLPPPSPSSATFSTPVSTKKPRAAFSGAMDLGDTPASGSQFDQLLSSDQDQSGVEDEERDMSDTSQLLPSSPVVAFQPTQTISHAGSGGSQRMMQRMAGVFPPSPDRSPLTGKSKGKGKGKSKTPVEGVPSSQEHERGAGSLEVPNGDTPDTAKRPKSAKKRKDPPASQSVPQSSLPNGVAAMGEPTSSMALDTPTKVAKKRKHKDDHIEVTAVHATPNTALATPVANGTSRKKKRESGVKGLRKGGPSWVVNTPVVGA